MVVAFFKLAVLLISYAMKLLLNQWH